MLAPVKFVYSDVVTATMSTVGVTFGNQRDAISCGRRRFEIEHAKRA